MRRRGGGVGGQYVSRSHQLLIPDWNVLVMHHYKDYRFLNTTEDPLMRAVGPAIRAELRRAYPAGIPCQPEFNPDGCSCSESSSSTNLSP